MVTYDRLSPKENAAKYYCVSVGLRDCRSYVHTREEILDQYADRIVYRSSVTIQYLMMNMQSPLLKDIRIRKAIQMAIDRKGILDELYGGAGSLIDGIYPKGLFGFCEENQGWLSYDPEEAKRLIAEVPDAGKIPVELAANYQNSARRLTILEMIQQDLNDVGLRADIVSYDGDTMMYLRRNSSLMLYTGEWSADFNDPDNFIYTLFGSRGKTYSRSSNFQVPSVFARIQKARGIQDREQRMQEYADLERILVQENAVWVPLFSTEHLFVLGDRVESFSPFWAGWSSMYFRDVVLKEGK
jgi:ABC-type transport system substrate-binding protein